MSFNVRGFCWTEAAMLLTEMVCYKLVQQLGRCVLKTAEASLVRLKTLWSRTCGMLAIPGIYGSGGRSPTLPLGVQHGSLRAKIRYWLERIQRLGLRLFNPAKTGQLGQWRLWRRNCGRVGTMK